MRGRKIKKRKGASRANMRSIVDIPTCGEEMEKEGKLLLFQIDHLSGEEIGNLIEMLYNWGANNVQVISTVTKKNRPGHIVVVDIGPSDEPHFVRELARGFSISGYHQVETIHCYHPLIFSEHELIARCEGQELRMTICCKHIGIENEPLYIHVEYDDLRKLTDHVQDTFGLKVSLPVLRQRIETLLASGNALVLELKDLCRFTAAT
jgi:uncharacterized protein (DUF111 family)